MRKLVLPVAVLRSLIAHAQSSVPAEAVGMIGGDISGQAACAIHCKNLAGIGSFFVDPYSQYQALMQIRAGGHTPLAVYHSHPGGGVELSLLDQQFAVKVGLIQLVVALARPHLPDIELGAYWVSGLHHIEKVKVIIE